MTNLLAYRFPVAELTLKPGKVSGQSALCLVYADSRSYQDGLDAAGVVWSSSITAVNDKTAIVTLSIDGVCRSASGEDSDFMSAEARGFKRACSAFGLGRYLYSIDLGFQSFDGRHFAPSAYTALQRALAALDSTPTPEEVWQGWANVDEMMAWGVAEKVITCPQHGKNALRQVVDSDLGGHLTQDNWRQACELFYHNRLKRSEEKVAAKLVKLAA